MIGANHSNPVILNLFQDPFLPARGAWFGKLAGPILSYFDGSGRAARWVLKQVQDDEKRVWGEFNGNALTHG
ncbi:MAG: hypothetical protein ABJA20_09585 [Novosphingobium sp.]